MSRRHSTAEEVVVLAVCFLSGMGLGFIALLIMLHFA